MNDLYCLLLLSIYLQNNPKNPEENIRGTALFIEKYCSNFTETFFSCKFSKFFTAAFFEKTLGAFRSSSSEMFG